MLRKKHWKCPFIDVCEARVTEETYKTFCTSDRYDRCIYYAARLERRKPR